MKLLLFSDLHRDVEAARQLVEQSQRVDVVIGAGDFASVRRGIEDTIAILCAIECPTVLVPGNNESYDELVEACREWSSAFVLHGTGTTIDGVHFFGLGAAVPVTPFGDWSFDVSEEDAATMLDDCPSDGILVSHSPPKGAVDVSSAGKSLGSTSVRAVIEAKQPKFVVCGHIHDSAGQTAEIGKTTVINAGPVGTIWEL